MGSLWHRRREPTEHRFAYPVHMTLLDLTELPGALDAHPLWSASRPAPVRFRPGDHLRDAEGTGPRTATELADRARAMIHERTGLAPEGPVRILSAPRTLGVGFNPVTFIYVHPAPDEPPAAVIAEVTNTPWGERHSYVVTEAGGELRATVAKRMHVSPFNPMEQSYELRIGAPGESLEIGITNLEEGRTVFSAGLNLNRRELTRGEMSAVMASRPAAVAANVARIYAHGLRLRLKGVPHHPHPQAGARTG